MKTIRHIAPFVLLAAYMPLLVTLSFHTHDNPHPAESKCPDCAHHVTHRAHLAEAVMMAHNCIYCQLTSTSYLGTEPLTLPNRSDATLTIAKRATISHATAPARVASPRAPPLQ